MYKLIRYFFGEETMISNKFHNNYWSTLVNALFSSDIFIVNIFQIKIDMAERGEVGWFFERGKTNFDAGICWPNQERDQQPVVTCLSFIVWLVVGKVRTPLALWKVMVGRLFGKRRILRRRFCPCFLTSIVQRWLLNPLFMVLIRIAVFGSDGNRSPSLDGFPMPFFQHNWNCVRGDLEGVLKEFFEWNNSISKTFVCLIPKKIKPSRLRTFALLTSSQVFIKSLLRSWPMIWKRFPIKHFWAARKVYSWEADSWACFYS